MSVNTQGRFPDIYLGIDGKKTACNAGDWGSIPGSGRSLGENNGHLLQYSFLENSIEKALPGGITNILAVLMAQAFGVIFGLPEAESATVCVSVLSVVGLLVLFETCKPFDKFRAVLWGFLAAGIALCFTLLRRLFELQVADSRTLLVMAALMLMTPTVFFAMQRLFDWGDKLVALLRQRRCK